MDVQGSSYLPDTCKGMWSGYETRKKRNMDIEVNYLRASPADGRQASEH